MAKPPILLVPSLTEAEWRIRPDLEEWADVASFDAPGVGEEPGSDHSIEAIVARGLEEIDRRGWERCSIVGDEMGAAQAARIAAACPSAARALVMGHPALDFNARGRRASLKLKRRDALVRSGRPEWHRRATGKVVSSYMNEFFVRAERTDLLPTLRDLAVPMLLVEHAGCPLWTREGFADAIGALPNAVRTSIRERPSESPAFAGMLRDFVAGLPE